MKQFQYILSGLALCVAGVLSVHAQDIKAKQWTLQECIDYAYSHNIDIQKQQEIIHQREIQLKSAENARLPVVSATVQDNFNFHYPVSTDIGSSDMGGLPANVNLMHLSGSVDMSMPLIDGGQIKHGKEAAKFNLEAALAGLDNARKNIGINVAAQYLMILYYRGLADVSRKQVQLSRDLERKAQSQVKNGSKPESELAQARAQLARDEYTLSQDAGNEKLATIELAQLLTMDNVSDFAINDASLNNGVVGSALDVTSQEIFNRAVENYPSIRVAEAQINAAEANIKVEKGKRLPTLSLIGSVGTQSYEVFNSDYRNLMNGFFTQLNNYHNEILGVRLSIPIFNRYDTRNAIKLASSQLTMQKLELSDARIKLRTEIEKSYYNAQVAATNHESALKAENSAHINYDYQLKGYNAGRATIFDLNQANQQWLKTQEEVLQTKYDYLIRLKILDFYTSNSQN